MRVGFDARWYNDSGVGTYVAGLLGALAASSRELELIVYEHPSNRVPVLDGLSAVRIPFSAPKYSFTEQFEFRRRARQDKLDVFHSPFYIVPLGLNCPVIVTLHDLITFLFRVYSWPRQAMVNLGYRTAARKAQHIIAVSRNTAKDIGEILSVPEERITVVYNAATECFQPASDDRELDYLRKKFNVQPPYVMTASSRQWRIKNLPNALKVLETSRRQSGIEFQTVVYGPALGIDAVGGEQSWASLQLRRTGFVATEDLAALFRHAQAFITPSLYEGFGLPLLEAMSCGCPVVTSNGGSLAEVAGTGAQVFSASDINGMAGAVVRLLSDPGERSQWRTRALKQASCFSWDKAAEQTIAVYRRAVASRG